VKVLFSSKEEKGLFFELYKGIFFEKHKAVLNCSWEGERAGSQKPAFCVGFFCVLFSVYVI